MSGVGKIAARIGIGLAVSFAAGYAEYRIKGGKPIIKLYKEVKAERLAQEQGCAVNGNVVYLDKKNYKVD